MKAAPGELPVGGDWVYELKWDGMRIVSFLEAGEIRLQSTNLLDVTVSFPELHALPQSMGDFDSLIFDGEVVALDETGRPSFNQLQQRMHIKDSVNAARRAAAVPVVYVIFDVLHINGQDTFSLPYSDRRRLLEQIIEPGSSWRRTEVHDDGGQDLLDAVTAQQMEGLIAKRTASTYVPGKRTTEWRKIKPRGRQELVIGGWVSGEGNRQGRIGAFDVGYWDATGFRYAGRVGSGLTDADQERFAPLLAELTTDVSPFVDPVDKPESTRRRTWVTPKLVIEVAFGEWSPTGHLRHPSYLGQRFDVDPAAVTREA